VAKLKTTWLPEADDLKHYPHFDKELSIKKIKALVNNPKRVQENTFYPFMLYEHSWQPFRKKDEGKPDRKERPIRYASRRDAYIFAKYRYDLALLYEQKLEELGISACPIAYRKISKSGSSGKCNIDFAKDAFDYIDNYGNCIAIALDISKFFESLDHKLIYKKWCELLDCEKLPADHLAVYKNITRYAFVLQREVYLALGYIVLEKIGNRYRDKYTKPFKDIPKQICDGKAFKDKVAPLIQKNSESFGIPQGAPISDLIANFYLLNFDVEMNKFATDNGGIYMRYSDDILIILPGDEKLAAQARTFSINLIQKFGDQIKIKDAKTSIVKYYKSETGPKYEHIYGTQGKNGLEYLGFRYDGVNAFIRESTISRLHRKISLSASAEAIHLVKRYRGKDIAYLISKFNYSVFSQRFGKVKEFEKCSDDVRDWTFWTYVKRAEAIFGDKGRGIPAQVRNQKSFIEERVCQAIVIAHTRELNQSANSAPNVKSIVSAS